MLLGCPLNAMSSDEKQNGFKEAVKGIVDQVLPDNEVNLETIKEEMWQDLSALYYKYEALEQKRAFREVMHEISGNIVEGKWDSVYQKLYRAEQEEKAL